MSSSSQVEASFVHNNLALLSVDSFERITHFLGFYDIMALEMVGNSKLSAKLEQSVTEINARIPTLFSWSFLPFRYRSLRRISLKIPSLAPFSVIIAPNDHLIPIQGHATLESLHIENALGLHILRSHPDRPPLSSLLPNLSHLFIQCYGVFEDDMMRNVPPTVTHLNLTVFSRAQIREQPPLDITLLNDLPKALQTFAHSLPFTIDRNDLHSLKSKVSLPPTLETLEIGVTSTEAFMPLLTDSVTYLILLFDCQETEEIRISDLPKKLAYFELIPLNLGILNLIPDVPFPSTLTHLSYVGELVQVPGKTITNIDDLYPSSLKFFSSPPAMQPHNIGMICPNLTMWYRPLSVTSIQNFKRLTSLNIANLSNCEELIRHLPISLTNLGVKIVQEPHWIEAVTNLINLKSLTLASPGVPLPRDTFWQHMHTRLQSLQCSWTCFESIEDMGSENWIRLSNLSLTGSSLERLPSDLQEFIDCHPDTPFSPENPVRYPSKLKSLTLWVHDHNYYFWPAICLLTRLTSLNILQADSSAKKIPGAMEFLERLPSTLRGLYMKLPHSIEPKSLSNLPKGLKQLEFNSNHRSKAVEYRKDVSPDDIVPFPDRISTGITYGDLWTMEHFLHLPLGLQTLKIRGPTMLDPSRLDFLPPTILEAEISFEYNLTSRAIKEQDRLYLLQ